MTQFITFSGMAKAMREDLRLEVREKVPFAAVVALTQTAIKARDLMKDHMRQRFDRPTPFALNAARAVPATKQTMASAVLLREFGGTPAEKFLGPEISGGGRGQKGFEKALSFIHALPPGGFATPGAGAALNQYGNQTTGELTKILSVLKAFGEQGYRANRTKGWSKRTREGQVFVVPFGANRPGLKPGVYRRGAGGTVIPLLIFPARPPEYRVRLPFYDLVMADAEKLFPAELEKALAHYAD